MISEEVMDWHTTCHVEPRPQPQGSGSTGDPLQPCTCANLCIYVPPGTHTHVLCPRHGDVVVHGSGTTC